MLILVVTLLGCLLGTQSQTTVPGASTITTNGNYKFHKPDNTAACVLPYFVHVTLSLPEGIGNATLMSIVWGQMYGQAGVPLAFPNVGAGSFLGTRGGVANAFKGPTIAPTNLYPFGDNVDGVPPRFVDVNNVPVGDMIQLTLIGLASQITLVERSLQDWSPWQIYVPNWIRELKWMVWEYLDNALGGVNGGSAISAIPVAITSTPPCLFSGAVSKDGKSLRLWFVHCVTSIFDGNFAFDTAATQQPQLTAQVIAQGQVAPSRVPGVFLFDMLTLHIPYPWLATNPCFPEVIVTMEVTFFKWTGMIGSGVALPTATVNAAPNQMMDPVTGVAFGDNGNTYVNAYLQIGPITADNPFVTTAVEMYTSALVAIAVYPGSNAQGVAANTIQNTALSVITVMFVPGAQLQGGNTVSIVVSIGALSIFNTPWQVTYGIIFANPATANLNGAVIAVGPTGTCAAFPGSVNCCAQSTGLILVPWPSYMSYPAWWNSFIVKLLPPGCVLPAGKVVTFTIGQVFLGRNPNTVTAFAATVAAAPVQFPVTSFWQVVVLLATSAEPQGIFTLGFLELWPLTFVAVIPNFEAVGPIVPISSWDAVTSGGLGNWVIGFATPTSVRYSTTNNVAYTQPTAITITITLRNQLATVLNGNTNYWFVFTTVPAIFRPNVGSVSSPIPIGGSSPAACNTQMVLFTSPLNTLFATSNNPACQGSWGANAVIQMVVPTDFLLPNSAAGTTVFHFFRIVPSMAPGGTPPAVDPRVGDAVFPIFNYYRPGGVIRITNQFPDTAGLMWQPAFTIVAECRNIGYQPSAVTDLSTATLAARCQLVNQMSYISPSPTGILTCNPGATTASAQNLITFIKYAESSWTPTMWPGMNDAQRGTWPQQVNLPGTIPIYIYSLGYMFSIPMFAVIVTYPATRTNLNALGVAPSVPSNYILAFIVKLDRLTSACSVNTVEENPWIFCATINTNVVQLLHFPSAPIVTSGVPLNQYSPYYGWTRNALGICAIVRSDGAVAGWYVTGASPNPGDGSDAAWYAFFAFFALPLLCLLCCLAWALWYFRRPKECCPCVPEYPVQEMYWVNAQPACPAPVYMVEPAVTAPVTCPPTTPIYLVQ